MNTPQLSRTGLRQNKTLQPICISLGKWKPPPPHGLTPLINIFKYINIMNTLFEIALTTQALKARHCPTEAALSLGRGRACRRLHAHLEMCARTN